MKSWFLRKFLRLKDVRDAIACGDIDCVYEILHNSGVDKMLTTPNRIAEVTKYLLETMSLDELLSKVTKIADWMFDCMELPKEVVIPKNITEIGVGCFSYCKSIEKVFFESGSQVERIDNWAFEVCEDLKVVDLGNCHKMLEINADAFKNCTNLTDIILPPNLEWFTGFDHCTNLTNIVLPSKVKAIKSGAFWSCTALKSITIPASVKTIGHAAFCNCASLKDVYYDGSKEQWEKIHIGEKNNSLLGAVLHFENENWVGDERCV